MRGEAGSSGPLDSGRSVELVFLVILLGIGSARAGLFIDKRRHKDSDTEYGGGWPSTNPVRTRCRWDILLFFFCISAASWVQPWRLLAGDGS